MYSRTKFVVWRVAESSCRPWVSSALCFLLTVKVNQSWGPNFFITMLLGSISFLWCITASISLTKSLWLFCVMICVWLFLEIRGGRGVPGVTRTESRCPGVDEGEEGLPPERRASQSSVGPTASSIQTLPERPALRAAAWILQPEHRGAEEGAAAEVITPQEHS